jgi:hypothetical protein
VWQILPDITVQRYSHWPLLSNFIMDKIKYGKSYILVVAEIEKQLQCIQKSR